MSNKPMTKTQLVAAIADAMDGDKKTASAALDAIAAVVSKEIAAGGSVTLPGPSRERQSSAQGSGRSGTRPSGRRASRGRTPRSSPGTATLQPRDPHLQAAC